MKMKPHKLAQKRHAKKLRRKNKTYQPQMAQKPQENSVKDTTIIA
jgi:hypothetical protein